ncbi:hypothetical protein Tco_0695941, partial [Tanacetum coccineum]
CNNHGDRRFRPNQNWGHVDSHGSSEEEGDDGYGVLARKHKGRFSGPRVMNRRNEGRCSYGDQQGYRVMAEIPNFKNWES